MRSKTIKIFCSYCQDWFASPLDLADEFASDTSILEGSKVTCQGCSQAVVCNRENISLSVQDTL